MALTTIKVKLPSGTIQSVKVPSDWDSKQIESSMRQYFPDEYKDVQLPEPKEEPKESTGILGLAGDLIGGLGNALKGGAKFAADLPEMVEDLASEAAENPISGSIKRGGHVLAGAADIGKSLINAPYDLNQYLAKKNLLGGKYLSEALGKLGKKMLPHIPEDTGVEKALGLEPTRPGERLLHAAPNILMGASAAKSLGGAIKNKVTSASKERLFKRALESKIDAAAEEVGLEKSKLNNLKESLRDEYSRIHGKKVGELTPIGQQEQINIKQAKLEANPKKGEVPEGELPKIPEKPDTKAMLEEHKELIEKAKADAEATVGIKTNPNKQVGRQFQKSISDLEKSSGEIYDSARDYYKDKKIMADNTAEIKAASEELEALKDADELAPGSGSGAAEQKELQDTINRLKTEQVQASDVFSIMRTSQQMANKVRMKRKGATEAEWNRLTNIADKLDRHADKLAKRLEEVGGQDVRSMIKEANRGYRTFKELTVGKFEKGVFKTNPISKEAFKTGNVPNTAMSKLADDLPGNKFLNELVQSDPELRKNLLAAYSGESNINKLTNPNSLTKKYLESLPEVEDKLIAFKKAVADYKGKEKEAVKIDKAHEELAESMKQVAEAKKLGQEIQFHRDAIPPIKARMEKLDAKSAEHAKLQKELKMHEQNLADKNHLLKKYGKYVAGYVIGNEVARKLGL